MNFTNTDLVSIYNSRQTLIDVMQGRGYDVSSYNNFNINEVEAMAKNNYRDVITQPRRRNLVNNIEDAIQRESVEEVDMANEQLEYPSEVESEVQDQTESLNHN